MNKRYELFNLNCYQVHVLKLDMMNPKGVLVRGTAVGPDDNRYSHTWIETDEGETIDLFNWTEHRRETTIPMPDESVIDELMEYIYDNYSSKMIAEALWMK